MRTGSATSPLHYGKAPAWLFAKMTELAREVTLALVSEAGPEEVLRRLSDPLWFQAFGCVLGFDWHSSGVTTTVCGALKEGLKGLDTETGLFVAGGKGRTSRQTPAEIETYGARAGLETAGLVYASRMSAKVDSAALQDCFQIYHHCFIFTAGGSWAVVQQGMNTDSRLARRYHWLSDDVRDFVVEPHSAICGGKPQDAQALNMVAMDSDDSRRASVYLVKEEPQEFLAAAKQLHEIHAGKPEKTSLQLSLPGLEEEEGSGYISGGISTFEYAPNIELPRRHPIVTAEDVNPDRVGAIILEAHERQPASYEELLGLPGVGPKAIRALSLIGELLYGAAPSYADPARYSFAHGGKDGFPYPVDQETYAKSIDFLRDAVRQAKVGRSDRLKALARLGKMQK